MEKELYFAYGSNLLASQMDARCPDNMFVGIGKLVGYKLVFDGHDVGRDGPIGNVVVSPRDIVWGAVYAITHEELLLLDKFEDYPRDYDRVKLPIIGDAFLNGSCMAEVYYREPQQVGIPHPAYGDVIRKGAIERKLPQEYIEKYL